MSDLEVGGLFLTDPETVFAEEMDVVVGTDAESGEAAVFLTFKGGGRSAFVAVPLESVTALMGALVESIEESLAGE